MPIESRPGFVSPGARPPQIPLPPGYAPPIGTGPSNLTPPGSTGVSPGTQAPMQQGLPDNFFGFFLLLMGL